MVHEDVASRVSDAAGPGQILLTEKVVDGAGPLRAQAREVGARLLRGVDQPTALFRIEREKGRVDPVCGNTVTSPPAARITRDGTEHWFCSEDCLRRFLEISIR